MAVSTAEAQCRMRAKLAELARAGVRRVLLYGAGRHTLKVGPVLADAPLEIVGIVDDLQGAQGRRLWNWPVVSPEESVGLGAQAVIISSDALERQLYAARADWFASNGITVHRLYSPEAAEAAGGSSTFTDSDGVRHALIPGYREHVKPGAEGPIAARPGEYPIPTPQQARLAMAAALQRVNLLEKYLRLLGFSIRQREALEIGCWDGACTYALVLRGCRRAVGIDHQDYFLWDLDPEQISGPERAAARDRLRAIQAVMGRAAAELGSAESPAGGPAPVELLIDDVNAPDLGEARFDLVCSWQTLEHLVPPDGALAAIGRLLRPGGLCFAEYGAFTSRKGGHALCTLDIPWGHVRLGEADVERYLRQCRPGECEHALRHYRRFLNRLTLTDVVRLAEAAGLAVVHQTVWLSRQQFEDELQPEYLDDARRHYPGITFEDMTHDDVWLLLRKPA